MYGALADLVILFHSAWILFLVFGFPLALRWGGFALVHLGGLLFSLLLNAMNWYCPLTHLEGYLISLHNGEADTGPFLTRYLSRIVYPALPVEYIRGGEIVFVCLCVAFYAYFFRNHPLFARVRGYAARILFVPRKERSKQAK